MASQENVNGAAAAAAEATTPVEAAMGDMTLDESKAATSPTTTTPEEVKAAAAVGSAEAQGLLAQITCLHCTQALQDARMLPCLHSFCLGCLRSMAGEFKAFKCPQC